MGYIYEKIHSFYLKHDSLCMIYELAHIVGFMIRYGCYAPTRFLVDDSRRLMFFVNPKVASSSIKASIYEGGGGIERWYINPSRYEKTDPCKLEKEI